MAERIDYLSGLEKAGSRSEAEQRDIDGRAGRYGLFEDIEGTARVTAWQVPRQGQPIGPSPAFLGPQWSVGPAPDGRGAVVLDKRNNQTSLLPPGAWLIRYEDGGEVVGIDEASFASAYTFLGPVGADVTKKRAEPHGGDVEIDPGAPPAHEEARRRQEGGQGSETRLDPQSAPGRGYVDESQPVPLELARDEIFAAGWKEGYAHRVREDERREVAIQQEAARRRPERIDSLAIDRFVVQVCADNERLRHDLERALDRAEHWQRKAEQGQSAGNGEVEAAPVPLPLTEQGLDTPPAEDEAPPLADLEKHLDPEF